MLRFAPASRDQPRLIEVCNIGRRSLVTHQALLDDTERRQSFYYYDTVAASGADLKQRTFRVDSPHEHRRMLATLLKHSRYFIANRSQVNKPEFTAGRDEISARFYEGAAAGTVMIGEAPRTEEFKQQFDWPDAVIHLPFDSPDIGRILADLNGDPERLRAIRAQQCSGGRAKARLATSNSGRVRYPRPGADRENAGSRETARADRVAGEGRSLHPTAEEQHSFGPDAHLPHVAGESAAGSTRLHPKDRIVAFRSGPQNL